MAHLPHIFDMSAAEKRAELAELGFEKEHTEKPDSELSALLGQARTHPRPMIAGIPILRGVTENLDTIRPHLLALKTGEKHEVAVAADMGQTEKITFTILAEVDAQAKLAIPSISHRVLRCPRCNSAVQLYYKRTTSDGNCGIEFANQICKNLTCGLDIDRYYEGYGSIFD